MFSEKIASLTGLQIDQQVVSTVALLGNYARYVPDIFIVVVLLFYVHGKHLRSCRDGQLI